MRHIRQEALRLTLPSFYEQKQLVLSYFVNQDGHGDARNESLVEDFFDAVDHIEYAAERMVARGVMDRVHTMYVDRLDRSLIALSGLTDTKSQADALPSALAVLNGFLDQFDQAQWQACLTLDCVVHGVWAPLGAPARAKLLASAARMMSVDPALALWLSFYDLAESDQEFLMGTLRAMFGATWYEFQYYAALIHGADEAERATYVAYHNQSWADHAVWMARWLLTRYEATAVPR